MNICETVISEEDVPGNDCTSLNNSGKFFDKNELPDPLRSSYPSNHHSVSINSEKPSPDKYSQYQVNSSLSRKRRKTSKYSHFEVKALLDVIGGTKPRSDKEWDTVRRLHLLYSNQDRSTRSLKKKFQQIKTMIDPVDAAFNCFQPTGSQLLMKTLVSSQLLPDVTKTTSVYRSINPGLTLHRVPRMYSLAINPVPNPLLAPTTSSEQIDRDGILEVPNVISIPSSPESGIIDPNQDDNISELGLDDRPKEDEGNQDF